MCWHPSGRIWRHWPADCLSCRPTTRLLLLRNVVSTPLRSSCTLEDSALHGQQGAQALRRGAAVNPVCSPQRGPVRMGGGSNRRCQYDGGDWGFVVLSCWHRLPTWHQPLAPRPLFRNFYHRLCTSSLTDKPRALSLLGRSPWSLQLQLRWTWPRLANEPGMNPCCQRSSSLLLSSAGG